jgi:lipopolysaccharide transport system ATP-binding protein
MKKDIVVKVENLSKKYQIGEKLAYLTLRDQLMNIPQKIFKKRKKTKDFLALKNISFEVKRGEVLGIIGRNGAGKSTLLKILAGITEPTKGRIVMRGRVASMLEVGTGFNPELTGRDNIYLNGSIIGMKKSDIDAKFDDIIKFADIGEFLDTPVKRYSSGMYVRLAFAVAAHLDSDILLVDEVLAVGDNEFQKKCLNKMKNLSKSGRTVIYVSHNLDSINTLCKTAVVLDGGTLKYFKKTREAIESYYSATSGVIISSKNTTERKISFPIKNSKPMQFTSLTITKDDGKAFTHAITEEDSVECVLQYQISKILPIPTHLALTITNNEGINIIYSRDIGANHKTRVIRKQIGLFESTITIPSHTLAANIYSISISIFQTGGESLLIDNYNKVVNFQIIDKLNYLEKSPQILALSLPWETIKV